MPYGLNENGFQKDNEDHKGQNEQQTDQRFHIIILFPLFFYGFGYECQGIFIQVREVCVYMPDMEHQLCPEPEIRCDRTDQTEREKHEKAQ